MKECSQCHKPADKLVNVVRDGLFLSNICNKCAASTIPFASFARKYNRDRGREDYRRDIVQRFRGDGPNPEWAKAYPKQAREQFGDEFMRQNG